MSITVLIPHLLLVTIFYIMVREEANNYYTFMFQLSECARRCSPALLNELLVKNKQPELSTTIDKKTLGDAFAKIVLAAEPSAQEDIEIELRNVQDMTGGASVRLLTERAFASTHTLPDKFDEFSNYDKALWITKEVHDEKLQELKDKMQLLKIELEEHSKADYDYQTTVVTVLSLARRAKAIFDSSEIAEKRLLISFLVQNPKVDGKQIVFSLKSPFDLMLNLAGEQRKTVAISSNRLSWLRELPFF